MSAIGLDLGATWIRGVNLHPDGSLGSKVREPTPDEPKQAAEQLFELWERLGGDEMVGLAAAPSLDECGRVRRWPNRPKYAGTDLLGAFLDRRCAPLILDDASAGAVAEHLSATEEQCLPSSTAYISVGTGVGGGIILHDQLWSGVTGQAMDVGHIPVPSAVGKECLCGGSGCLQTIASGRYLQNLARESGFPMENIPELAAANARFSESLISLAAPLAEGILIVEKLFEPQRIILGGGLMEGNILFNSICSAAQELGCITPVFKSRWGTWAGAVGAAAEVLRRSGLSLSRVNDR
jgi:glucokinase